MCLWASASGYESVCASRAFHPFQALKMNVSWKMCVFKLPPPLFFAAAESGGITFQVWFHFWEERFLNDSNMML